MATTLNFRTSMRGFNREDVIQYIEYSNAKHANQLNQLMNENEELRRKAEQASANAELTARIAQLEEEKAQLQAQLEEAKATKEEANANSASALELETYRRAEQFERNAKARADQIYRQATGTIAQATTQVDNAAVIFQQLAGQVNEQMTQLQQAVNDSKAALMDAAATMYAIRPEAE